MKKEKNKVGRPKLADKKIKKKAILMVLTSFVLVVFMLAGFVFYTNINLFNLKGATTTAKKEDDNKCYTSKCPKPSKKNAMNEIVSCYDNNKDVANYGNRIKKCYNMNLQKDGSVTGDSVKSFKPTKNVNDGTGLYKLSLENVLDLNGKIMQNFEVTDKYIYASYKATVYKIKKTNEKKKEMLVEKIVDNVSAKEYKDIYAAKTTTTIRKFSRKNMQDTNESLVLRNSGHAQNFDVITINGKDYVYTNSVPFEYNDDNPVFSKAFQIVDFSSSINANNKKAEKIDIYNSENQKIKNNNIFYNPSKTIVKSNNYYFAFNSKTGEYKLIRSDITEEQKRDLKVLRTNIQVAVDGANKLIAVHAFGIKKIFIFNMKTNKSGSLSENVKEQLGTVTSPVHIIDLCKDGENSYSCIKGTGNQGIAFYNNRIYIALGGDDHKEDSTGNDVVKEQQLPTITRISLKKNKDGYSDKINSISFNIRGALKSFCNKSNVNASSKCNLNERVCFDDNSKIGIEVEGISASKEGVYLGVVIKQYAKKSCTNDDGKDVEQGVNRFNYIYRLKRTDSDDKYY